MAQVADRADVSPGASVEAPSGVRPVVLATLSVRIDPNAERMAFESALDARAELIIANMIAMRAYPMTMILAPQYMTLPHEEDLDAVRATAERAAARGIKTELLRITTAHPVSALIELVRERSAGLLVLGPDVKRTSRWRLRLAARRVRRDAPCLVWIAPDG
jgi:nucleotide-binding universal stress UspA family protein